MNREGMMPLSRVNSYIALVLLMTAAAAECGAGETSVVGAPKSPQVASGCDYCHIVATAVVLAAESPPRSAVSLDQVSAGCIVCHDEQAAVPADVCRLMHAGKMAGVHVVGAIYAHFAAYNRGLRPPGDLPVEVVLDEGKITCGTCHGGDPHVRIFVIDNVGSALCSACHLQ